MSSWRGRTSSTPWTRRCSRASATPSARSGATGSFGRSFFRDAEVDVAITADLGTLQRLGYLIPQGVLRELAYTGRRMDSGEAARLGLVNRLLPDRERTIEAAMEIARTIAAKSPLAVAGAKRNLNYSRGRPVEEGLRDVAAWNMATLASADLGEAFRARLEKREARFGPLED